jgi:hypothetical protein
LGLGVFSIIQIQTEIIDPSRPASIIVGHWESLYRDMDNPDFNSVNNWLIEVGDSQINNSAYILLNQTTNYANTRFHLLKSGWYRVNLVMLWTSCSDGIYYSLNVWKNDVIVLVPELTGSANGEFVLNSHFYISSNSTNYYEFSCYTSSDDFYIDSIQEFNQLVIEYIGEY